MVRALQTFLTSPLDERLEHWPICPVVDPAVFHGLQQNSRWACSLVPTIGPSQSYTEGRCCSSCPSRDSNINTVQIVLTSYPRTSVWGTSTESDARLAVAALVISIWVRHMFL